MIFRSSTETGDWVFGRGLQSYLTTDRAIMRNVETKLRTFLTECFFDSTVGIPWFQILGVKDSAVTLLTIKSAILDCYGVVRINDVQFSLDDTRALNITYNADTIYTAGIVGSVTV